MENILVVIDGARMDKAIVDFSCYLAKLTKSRLIAMFIEQQEEAVYSGDLFANVSRLTPVSDKSCERQQSLQLCELNEKLFAENCINNGLDFTITRQCDCSAEQLVQESRFTDVMVINPQITFSDQLAAIPSGFAKQVLEKAECPVIIAPGSFEGIERLLFAYDGSRSCVFAIKQFAHIFPQLRNLPVTVLLIGNTEEAYENDLKKIKKLLSVHFPNNHFELLEGSPEYELFGYLLGKRNMFVIMGAYGRNNISRFFRQSTADLVMKTINLPVFITHS